MQCVLVLLIVITCGASVYTATNGNMCAKMLKFHNLTDHRPCPILDRWPPANVIMPHETSSDTTTMKTHTTRKIPFIVNDLEAKLLKLATCPIMRSIEPYTTRFCNTTNTSQYAVHTTLKYNYLKIEFIINV